jgi:Plasmid pRiA4b ORF-3-like protein
VSHSVERSAMSDTATHIFRVELRPDLYREIEVFSGMALDFFAAAIVKAFGFDFDHPYGFYSKLTGRVFASTPRYEVPGILDDPDALNVEEVAIEAAFRRVGKALLFVYDFGDDWRFRVTFTGRGRMPADGPYFRLVGSMGDAPPQYPVTEDE